MLPWFALSEALHPKNRRSSEAGPAHAGSATRPGRCSTKTLLRSSPSSSYRFLNSTSRSLLQTVLEVDPRSVVQLDPKVVRRPGFIQRAIALRGLVENPLLSGRI